MDKRAVIQDLHATIVTRLFGGRPWLADREACDALDKKLDELGLHEHVPGDIFTRRSPTLGQELQLDLVMVFIGLWDVWEIPTILEQHSLIDAFEVSCIHDLLETCSDPEHLLRPIVRKAFRDHYNPSGLLV